MNKETKEWTVGFPWGKVAMISWGDDRKPPVLLLHGYMDSAATFLPLLEYLPDDYYYVAPDLPGHGKSDHFPAGVMVFQIHMVEVIRGVVEHMKWNNFMILAHSMGFFVGVYYNHIFPGKVTKMIHIDPQLPLSQYYFAHHTLKYWYLHLTDSYYNSYNRLNGRNPKRFTKEEAISILARNRSIPEDKAAIIVSRTLIPVEDGKYILSFDQRMKRWGPIPLSQETLFIVLTQNAPPTLIMEVTINTNPPPGKDFAKEIFDRCLHSLPNFQAVMVSGPHDAHITNPEEVAKNVIEFFGNNFGASRMLNKL